MKPIIRDIMGGIHSDESWAAFMDLDGPDVTIVSTRIWEAIHEGRYYMDENRVWRTREFPDLDPTSSPN